MNSIIRRNQDLFGGLMENLWNDSNWFKPELTSKFSMPAVNIKNSENEFEIELAAPGLKKEDFNIEVEENLLKLSVNKTAENLEEKENYTRKEFSYFNFQRSFALPKDLVDTENVQATYADGILKVLLPKQKELKESVKKITVQ